MSPHRICLIAITLLLCSACADHPRSPAPPPSTTTSTTTAATTADLVEECADSVAYWVRYLLTPGSDSGLDYQEMGLSGGENDIVRDLLPAAGSTAKRQGLPAAQSYALTQAGPRCQSYLLALSATPNSAPGWPK